MAMQDSQFSYFEGAAARRAAPASEHSRAKIRTSQWQSGMNSGLIAASAIKKNGRSVKGDQTR
jgi:hypothetical protein